jgi:hypothetical protein
MPYTDFAHNKAAYKLSLIKWYQMEDLFDFLDFSGERDLSLITDRREVVARFNSVAKRRIYTATERFPDGAWIPECETVLSSLALATKSLTDNRDANAGAKARSGASDGGSDQIAQYSFRTKCNQLMSWMLEHDPMGRDEFEAKYKLVWA